MANRRLLQIPTIALVLLTAGVSAWGADEKKAAPNWNPERKQVRVAYVTASAAMVELWVGVEKGYFKEYGLSVEPILTRTVSGIQALIAGDVQFVYSGCTQIMTARKAGADMVILASMIPHNLYTISARPEIREPKQLIGKQIAIAQLGDTTHLSARFALQQAGINPDAVTYVQGGGTPARLAMLESGAVDAAILSGEALERVKASGMSVVINLFERKLPYCNSGIGVSKAFMATNPRTVEAFMRGIVKGNAYAREGNPEDVKMIIAKYLKISPRDPKLIYAYNFYPKLVKSKHPSIPRDGIAFIISELAVRDKSWGDWRPEQFYDSTILDQLKDEGFLELVYQNLR